MAGFSQLPNEMISEIWGHMLEPEDVESFALVSKHIYAIGRPFVQEHNKLKREYSLFETGPGTRASAPAVLLKDVLLRPRVALYVTHLSIGRLQEQWQDSDDDGDDHIFYSKEWQRTRHVPYPDNDMALFIEAIKIASFVPRNEVGRWISGVRVGDEGPILAVLSLLLPKLTSITLKSTAGGTKQFPETIERIAKAENSTFLTRLTTVNLQVDFPFNDDSIEWLWLKIFTTLPLVQSIHVNGMAVTLEEDDLVDDGQYFIPGSSNITEMTFVESGVGPKTMFELLESIKWLKKFSYVEPDEELNTFEPFWMRAALLAHTKHSLETLRITFSQTKQRKLLGSFRDFTALKELETDVRLLIGWGQLDKLADLLPASIEELYLHTREDIECITVPELVEKVAKSKSQLIPNLRALKLRSEPEMGNTQGGRDLIKTLEEKCRDVGIELTIIAT